MHNKHHYADKQRVYDKFVSHVLARYPKISVCDFSDMPHAGVTHMMLPLDNVTKADQALFNYIAKFAEGTSLEATENIKTGAPSYVANVPYVTKSKGSKTKNYNHYDDDNDGDKAGRPPNTLTPVLLLVAILILVIVAVIKTDSDQWKAIAFWN